MNAADDFAIVAIAAVVLAVIIKTSKTDETLDRVKKTIGLDDSSTPEWDPSKNNHTLPVSLVTGSVTTNSDPIKFTINAQFTNDGPAVSGTLLTIGTLVDPQMFLGATLDQTFKETQTLSFLPGTPDAPATLNVTIKHFDVSAGGALYNLAFFWNGVQIDTAFFG